MIPSERRALQVAMVMAGCVPVTAGLLGIVAAPAILQLGDACGPTCDSHVRYLSGLLLAVGLIAWCMVCWIEQAGPTMKLLTFMVVIGGLARLTSVAVFGWPSPAMVGALVMELVVTPTLCIWQQRLSR